MEEGFEDLNSSLYERDERLLVAAQNTVKLLGMHRHASDNLKKLLADVDCELSAMKLLINDDANEFSDIRERLISAEEKIKGWISDQSMTWNSNPGLFAEYLESIDEIRLLSRKSESDELTRLAVDVLQAAMSRIDEELRDIFAHGFRSCESKLPAPCSEETGADKDSVGSDESVTTSLLVESSSTHCDHYVADLIHPDTIPVVKSIARVMCTANYEKEFCDTLVECQKAALDELLIDLGMEKFTIEELIKMDWDSLDGKIKTWIHVLETFVGAFLVGEKWLCDQIFEELGPIGPTIFANIASPIMSCLMNFGHGVAMGAHRPEKLFRLIDMVDALTKLCPRIYDLFHEEEEAAPSIKVEVEELLARLGCAAKATFLEFGDFVLSDPSLEPFPAGQIHHLTKYVVNYINILPAYKNTLNALLCIQDVSDLVVGIGVCLKLEEETVSKDLDILTSCPMAVHLRLIIDKLEINLETKSQLYKDASLTHIFILNNAHYIVQKVKNSDLRGYLGDDRIRKLIASYQHHAQCYLRSSWSWIVPLLKDEGGSGPSSSKKTILREKLRKFTTAFEELYKVQTGWCIKDNQLKQELRISIQKMIPAYQIFVTRCKNENLERHVKYEVDHLVDLLQDLFEGLVKSLNSSTWRRS